MRFNWRTPNSRRGGHRASIILIAASVVCLVSGAFAAERPNVVILFADAHPPGMTGFEGNPVVKTPNLDALAEESAYFTRCYTPTPSSAAALASVLTGKYPHAHKVTGADEKNLTPLSSYADTFTARMSRAGYTTGVVGVWHLPMPEPDRPGFGFNGFAAVDDTACNWQNCEAWIEGQKTPVEKFLTDAYADQAVRFIESAEDQPFLLWVGFRAPPEPPIYPPGSADTYTAETADLPATMDMTLGPIVRPARLQSSPPSDAFQRMGKPRDDDAVKIAIREARAKTYAMIARMDDAIGRILTAIDEKGAKDHTVVVFAGTHGRAIGDHKLYGAAPFFYEEIIRGPLLIRYPPLVRSGQRVDRVVGLVDLASTMMSLTQLDPPMTTQGQSLARLLRDPKYPEHVEEIFIEYEGSGNNAFPMRGIITRDYKFIDYIKDPDMFFALAHNGDETENQLGEPVYQSIIKVLKNRLDAWRDQTHDPLPTTQR